jgi:antitoxin HicB
MVVLSMSILTYPVVLYPNTDAPGAYIVEAPDLPGLTTDGPTIDTALANAHEAVALYLEELRARGEQMPQPGIHGPVALGSVTVEVA